MKKNNDLFISKLALIYAAKLNHLAAKGDKVNLKHHLNIDSTDGALAFAKKQCAMAPERPKGNQYTVRSIFSLDLIPKRLQIIGYDSEAVEFAQAFSRLGCKVSLFSSKERILYLEEDEVSRWALDHLIKDDIRLIDHLNPDQPILKTEERVLRDSDQPSITFTDPEIASIGIIEDKKNRGIEAKILSFDKVPRGKITNRKNEFIKVLVDRESDRIRGATVVSPRAGEMIIPFQLAISHHISLKELASCPINGFTYSSLLNHLR